MSLLDAVARSVVLCLPPLPSILHQTSAGIIPTQTNAPTRRTTSNQQHHLALVVLLASLACYIRRDTEIEVCMHTLTNKRVGTERTVQRNKCRGIYLASAIVWRSMPNAHDGCCLIPALFPRCGRKGRKAQRERPLMYYAHHHHLPLR